jgi:hypothetical protein
MLGPPNEKGETKAITITTMGTGLASPCIFFCYLAQCKKDFLLFDFGSFQRDKKENLKSVI